MQSKVRTMRNGYIGRINVTSNRIELLNDNIQPFHSVPYCVGSRSMECGEVENDKMIEKKASEPAQTEWALSIVFALWKDGIPWFCVNYRSLNAKKVQSLYLILGMEECMNSLGEGTVFSRKDANSGCWQVEIDEKNPGKTAFTSRN